LLHRAGVVLGEFHGVEVMCHSAFFFIAIFAKELSNVTSLSTVVDDVLNNIII
jgi:hypothetical protein